MKFVHVFRTLVFSLITVSAISFSHAQIASTQGTDFWFAFMINGITDGENPTQTCLILSAERACSVTVSNPNTGWSTTASIPAGGRVDVNIPIAEAYNTTFNSVSNRCCHLVATDVISAYTMNYKNASFDGAHLLPTETLADNYMIETIPPGMYGSIVYIIATEDNTVIDITPSAATSGGWGANTLHTITLNTGQGYLFNTNSASASLAGTVIQAHDCKRIAVFAGGRCAQAPSSCEYCDHVYEPMIPTIYWGNHFAVTGSLTRTKDVVRIIALNNNTTVSKNGTVVSTLAAGGTYSFELSSTELSSYIETSGPAACYLYLTGQNCGGGNGDPSMVYITPIEQNIKKIIFGTYYNSNTSSLRQYVNIVTPTSNVSSVTLDGSSISGDFTALAGNANYSYARLNISHATHTLECDSGLVAHVYGLGNVTSYAYNVGSSAIDLSSAMYINHVSTADLPEDYTYCPNLDIDFEVELNYGYDNITWLFGDGSSGTGNPVSHAYETPGSYSVTAIVERTGSSNCFGSTTDTLRGRVSIPPAEPIVENVVICGGGSYDFHGQILTETGIYRDTLESSGDCDSVIELHLSFVPTDPIPVYVDICDGGSYNFDGEILSEPGIYLDTITTSGGCDSIIELHLSIVPPDPVPVYASVCPGDSYNMNGRIFSEPGIYFDSTVTAGGCDSIVELHLTYAEVPTVNVGRDRVLCGEEEFPVSISAGTGNGLSYLWNTGATTSSISVMQDGIYAVTVTNQFGCTASDEMQIRLQDRITVDIIVDGNFCEEGGVHLSAITNAPNVTWSTGENTTDIEAERSGIYSVRAYDGPCEEIAAVELPKCPFYLYFPNCITPTLDDGMNDVFFLSNPDIVADFEIFIYDRWGMLVFHSTDPHFRWDGKHKGKIAANNVFSWKALATPRTEKNPIMFTGTILVL